MKTLIYSTSDYEKTFLEHAAKTHQQSLKFEKSSLTTDTANLMQGYDIACGFVRDDFSQPVLEKLAANGTKLIALRCAGFDNVDLKTAQRLNLPVVRVPAYSPEAVAEFTVNLMLSLSRHNPLAYKRFSKQNFLLDGLLGFNLHKRTVGVIGTGNIGLAVTKIMRGFNCKLLAYDIAENPECKKIGVQYTSLDMLLQESDIVTLHCPLTPKTKHIINATALKKMKNTAILINTARGAAIDTKALIKALKQRQIHAYGADVYEFEQGLYFCNWQGKTIKDKLFLQLSSMPNVILSAHQAFFTEEALTNIAKTTFENILAFQNGKVVNSV